MEETRLPHYGGQALIEGVLMRGKNFVVACMRNPAGEIVSEHEKLGGIYKSSLSRLPFMRGLVILWDSLSLGMKYITLSANVQMNEEEEKIEGGGLVLTLFISLALAIGLFFVLPAFLAELLSRWVSLTPFTVNLLEGLMRLLLMIGYIWVIGKTGDIARVFSYHGAEHKTINAFEDGIEITVENVMRYPLAHPRCGTSFLLTLVVMSVLVFSLLGHLPLWIKILTRIVLIPFLAMIAYELIRWMGDQMENPLVRLITSPNLALQRLTTREPDTGMIEVAISSFKQLLELENKVATEQEKE